MQSFNSMSFLVALGGKLCSVHSVMDEKMGLEVRLPSSKNWVLPSVKAVQLLPGPLFPYEQTEEIIVSILQGYCMDSLNECNVLEQCVAYNTHSRNPFIQQMFIGSILLLIQMLEMVKSTKQVTSLLHQSLGTYFLVGRGKQ